MNWKTVFFLLVIQSFAFSQNLSKKISLDSLKQTNLAIIYSSKKMGIYNTETNKILKPLGKNFYYYAEKPRILFEVAPSQMISAYYITLKNEILPFSSSIGNLEIFYNGGQNDGYFLTDNNRILDLDKETFIAHDYDPEMNNQGNQEYFSITLLPQNQLLINDFTFEEKIYVDIPLVDMNGEDSIILVGDYYETVYPDYTIPAEKKSGIYDFVTRTWKIAPQYGAIRLLNNVAIAHNFEFGWDGSFDFYEIDAQGNWTIVQKGTVDNEAIPYEKIFGANNFYACQSNGMIAFKSNEKWGIMSFCLMREFYGSSFTDFKCETLFAAEHDFVQVIGENNVNFILEKAGTYEYASFLFNELVHSPESFTAFFGFNKDYDYDAAEIYYDTKSFTFDYSNFDSCVSKNIMCLIPIDEKCPPKIFLERAVQPINDSLIYFQHIERENLEEPYSLVSVDGYDSVDFEGNLVYAAPDPGFYLSGVFNKNTSSWFISPEHLRIELTHKGFLIVSPVLDQNELLIGEQYSLKKWDGLYEFKNVSSDEFHNVRKYDLYKIPKFQVDSLRNSGYYYNPSQYNQNAIAYFETGGKIGQVDLRQQFILHVPVDFIYALPENPYFILLEEDSIHINGFDSISFSINSFQKIESFVLPNEHLHFLKITEKNQPSNQRYYSIENVPPSSITEDEFNKENEKETKQYHFIMERLNDSLVYIQDLLFDYQDWNPLIDEMGFDSMMYDPTTGDYEYVYRPLDKGHYYSGIYNLNSKKFIVQPDYAWIKLIDGKFLAKNKPNPSSNETLYSMFSISGELIMANMRFEDFDESIQIMIQE